MAESSIGVVYIEVAPSGKDFGKKLEGDIIQAVDNAAKTGGTSILGKFGGAFGKSAKSDSEPSAPSPEASPHSPPKAASNAPSTSKTRKPNSKASATTPKASARS